MRCPFLHRHVRDEDPLGAPSQLVYFAPVTYSPGNAPFTRAPEEEVERIIGWLREDGLPVRRRITEGRDVMAACGQLGNVELRRSRSLSRPCRPPTCGSASSARVLTFILAAVALACGWLLHG